MVKLEFVFLKCFKFKFLELKYGLKNNSAYSSYIFDSSSLHFSYAFLLPLQVQEIKNA